MLCPTNISNYADPHHSVHNVYFKFVLTPVHFKFVLGSMTITGVDKMSLDETRMNSIVSWLWYTLQAYFVYITSFGQIFLKEGKTFRDKDGRC